VVQDIRPRVEDRAQRRFVALEVRDEHLDAALGQARARLADGRREDRRAAVGEIVAIDRRDDDVVQSW
jgi:hypothetical protein